MALRKRAPGSGWAGAVSQRAGRLLPRARRERLRFEAALALRPAARLLDRARHPDVAYWPLDVAWLNTRFPVARRQAVAQAAAAAVAETDNVFYFQNVSWYNWRHRHLPRGLPALDDLYPPNLAVLDFLAHHVAEPADEMLLDFACGLGALLVYARELGYARVYGFDTWQYLARATAERFLAGYGLDGATLVEAEALAALPATIVTCIGYPLDLAMATSPALTGPTVRYLVVDRLGRPPRVPGFRRAGEYAGLLTVFERVSP